MVCELTIGLTGGGLGGVEPPSKRAAGAFGCSWPAWKTDAMPEEGAEARRGAPGRGAARSAATPMTRANRALRSSSSARFRSSTFRRCSSSAMRIASSCSRSLAGEGAARCSEACDEPSRGRGAPAVDNCDTRCCAWVWMPSAMECSVVSIARLANTNSVVRGMPPLAQALHAVALGSPQRSRFFSNFFETGAHRHVSLSIARAQRHTQRHGAHTARDRSS